jgi:hypothetical protein
LMSPEREVSLRPISRRKKSCCLYAIARHRNQK